MKSQSEGQSRLASPVQASQRTVRAPFSTGVPSMELHVFTRSHDTCHSPHTRLLETGKYDFDRSVWGSLGITIFLTNLIFKLGDCQEKTNMISLCPYLKKKCMYKYICICLLWITLIKMLKVHRTNSRSSFLTWFLHIFIFNTC